jgi:Bax protein
MCMTKSAFRFKHLNSLATSVALIALFAGGFYAGSPRFGTAIVPPKTHDATVAPAPALLGESLGPSTDALNPKLPFVPVVRTSAVVHTVAVDDTAGLTQEFRRLGYRLDASTDGGLAVPRVIVSTLPPDLSRLGEIDLRKSVFFQLLLPLVLQVNEAILDQRHRVVELRDRLAAGEPVTSEERHWLGEIASYYGVAPDDFDGLLKRVDIVPPSLALAQGAIESGWGTSRFALEGNALFGQYTNDESSGLVPASLTEGDVRVHAFSGLLEAVLSYERNLNTHPAYRGFRNMRARERSEGDDPDGYTLAGALTRYSARGDDYVRDVRLVIRANELDPFDDAWLAGGRVIRVVFNDT